MHNVILSERTARDIDGIVEKLLRELGHPQPPLRLEEIRDALSLDRAYFSATNDGVLRETVHRLKVAGKQILKRPSLLLDVVKKCSLRALWLPDRKRILIDSDIPKPKQRWNEAHEIGHSVIPWHEAMSHGDQQQTLSLVCQQQLEAEANYAAGRLLFLRDRFRQEFDGGPICLDRLRSVSKAYGNTITTGLWRLVEGVDLPCFGLVSSHPRHTVPEGQESVRYFIRSPRFAERFGRYHAVSLFNALPQFCRPGRGPIGEDDLLLTDDNGASHVFHFETFFNSYDALTLATHTGVYQPAVAMSSN